MNTDMWYQLPPDMQTWNNAVLDNISRKIPEIPQYISAITWSKLDPATGDGDGLVELMGGLGAAPIVIRNNKLAPVDVMATKSGNDTKFYPLSPLFLHKLYADNVIGEPVMNRTDRDESYEGPGRRIQHIKTVDNVKYASVESVRNILNEITKSASVANWMAERMPETLIALCDRASENTTEKVASVEFPELMVIWRDGDTFYANDEEVTSEIVGDFCKIANATEEERTGLMYGVPLVRDNRTKVAALHIPTDQELSLRELSAEAAFLAGEADAEDAKLTTKDNTKNEPPIALTTAYLKDGTSRSGIIFGKEIMACSCAVEYKHNGVPNHSGVPMEGHNVYGDTYPVRELFVCNDGFGFGDAIKTTVRVNLPVLTLLNMSEPSAPSIGTVGIIFRGEQLVDFGRIEEVVRLGNSNTVVMYSYIKHDTETHDLSDNRNYYEVNDNLLSMAKADDKVNVVSMTGVNGVISRDAMGDIIIDGVTHSAINCPYALMNKYAASYEDAVAVRDYALEHGRCLFDVVELPEKTAAENDNPDKTKTKTDASSNKSKDDKGTKAGTDDEELSPIAPQLSGISPETAMSGEFGGVPAGGQGSGQVGGPAGYVEPVTSKDMENVVQINRPQVMDAYIMSGLANGNIASRETMLHASDSVLSALEDLSQLLFLIRNGSLDFINENDVQVAMNKLTDVAQALGISNSSIGY